MYVDLWIWNIIASTFCQARVGYRFINKKKKYTYRYYELRSSKPTIIISKIYPT